MSAELEPTEVLLEEGELSRDPAVRAQAAVCRRELAALDSLLDQAALEALRGSRHLRAV